MPYYPEVGDLRYWSMTEAHLMMTPWQYREATIVPQWACQALMETLDSHPSPLGAWHCIVGKTIEEIYIRKVPLYMGLYI